MSGTVPHPRDTAVSAKMPVVSEGEVPLLDSEGHVSWLLDPSLCFSSEALLYQLFSASYLIFVFCFLYVSLGMYLILPFPPKTYFYYQSSENQPSVFILLATFFAFCTFKIFSSSFILKCFAFSTFEILSSSFILKLCS